MSYVTNGSLSAITLGNITLNSPTPSISSTSSTNPLNITSNSTIYLNNSGDIIIGKEGGSGNGNSITVNDTANSISLHCIGTTLIGDLLGVANGTYIKIDYPTYEILLNTNSGDINIVSPNVINLNATPVGAINLFTEGDIKIGNISGAGNQNVLTINPTRATLKTGNGFQLLDSNIQYPSTFYNTSQTITTTFPYAQSYNGTTLTATLPVVSTVNVGTQYLITNTNAGNMTVIGNGVQLIYFTGAAAATSRTLASGSSHIFTAIRTTTTSTFGWSMV